jgi:hypothetical protein
MDAERLKELSERLDTLWAALHWSSQTKMDDDSVQQEFLKLLETIAQGSRDEKMWRLVAAWAIAHTEQGEKV